MPAELNPVELAEPTHRWPKPRLEWIQPPFGSAGQPVGGAVSKPASASVFRDSGG